MIYCITNATSLLLETDIVTISKEVALLHLEELDIISCDTETTGLDPHVDKILMLQLGNFKNQYVIDCTTIDIQFFKPLLESKKLILQFSKFDLQMFYSVGIHPRKVYDTFLAESVLTAGYSNVGRSLEKLAQRYCNVNLNKTHRMHFTLSNYVMTESDIIYGAEDVQYLEVIKNKQDAIAISKGVVKAIDLENSFVLALAYIEFCGLYLDKEKWTAKYESAEDELRVIELELDNWVIDHGYVKYKQLQQDLFAADLNLIPHRKITLNWNSTKQILPLFKEIGINVYSQTNKSGEGISEKVLKPQKDRFEIIPLYLKYQTIQKDYSTYGAAFLEHIHPVTGRIHTTYDQMKNSSRLGSSEPNVQNLPRDHRTRSCFTAEKGNILVGSDYSAQEDVIFVNMSKESKMIEFYQLDNADGHSYVAKLCFPDELERIPLEEVKKLEPELRQIAKSAKFAIHYSGNGYTISNNLNLSEEEGERIYNAYLTAFPGIATYLKRVMKQAWDRGWILISPVTGRKFWCDNFQTIKREGDNTKRYAFAKLACNYPIQGQGAETIKISLILFYRWIMENDLLNIVKIVSTVHDEINNENPKELAELVAENLTRCMEQAGSYYCKTIPLKAESVISPFWKH